LLRCLCVGLCKKEDQEQRSKLRSTKRHFGKNLTRCAVLADMLDRATVHIGRMASPNLQRGRFSQVGAHYTITAITNRRRPLFYDSASASVVVRELEAASNCGIEPLAWVLMPDHLHIVLQLSHGALCRAMQAFKSRTARAQGAAGPIWQAGFYDHCIRNHEDLLRQARYVIENPLRRGLVARREDYPYWWCRWIDRPTAAL